MPPPFCEEDDDDGNEGSYGDHIGSNPCYLDFTVGHSAKAHDLPWSSSINSRWNMGRKGWRTTITGF